MSITREQVADLQPGDVVEYHNWDWPNGVTIQGALYTKPPGGLWLGDQHLRMEDGDVRSGDYWKGTLTVVSRAPRPLYVNHLRTEVKQHDVIRDGEGVIRHCDAAGFGGEPTWWSWNYEPGWKWTHTTRPPQPLTLLVDGETGQVVP